MSAWLAGLNASRVLMLGPWPQACLLVVTFGALLVDRAEGPLRLHQMDQIILVPHFPHRITAFPEADFLLINATPVPAEVHSQQSSHAVGRDFRPEFATAMFAHHASL